MTDLLGTLGDGLAAIAPTVASAFGGPLAGLAVTTLEKALGVAPGTASADPKGFQASLQTAMATPEQVLSLKQADNTFRQFCLDNELQLLKADEADRDSARQRQVGLRDQTPTVLALVVTAGFFGMLAAMVFFDLPTGNKDMLNVLLGSLGAAWVAVVSYYFGSSAGSRAKDDALATLSK